MGRIVVVLALLAIVERARAEPAGDAVRLRLEHVMRAEHLSHDFRAGAADDATALSLRTLAAVEATRAPLIAGLEVLDARTYASEGTPLNTTLINPVDLLQAYVGARTETLDVRAGRLTLDLGSRRLVARNRFRTTINAFTGVDASWTHAGAIARTFVVVPVTRRPAEPDRLEEHAFELDEENTDALLWGAAFAPPARARTRVELFVIGFHERDGDVASRDRQLVTMSARVVRPPAADALDYEVELLPQLGRSRETARVDDVAVRSHRALSWHLQLGISPAIAWSPRFALLHDYASGDRDPDDGSLERFDPLFGARRFDFGPTGVYGVLARSNLQSPGARISIAPRRDVTAFATYRLAWLASASDAWTTAGIRDAAGSSGTFVGEHVEVMARWAVIAPIAIEVGAAYLRRGRFAHTAPQTRTANPAYGYAQVSLAL